MVPWLNGSLENSDGEKPADLFLFDIFINPWPKCKAKQTKEDKPIFINVQSKEVTGKACMEETTFPRTLSNNEVMQ